MIFTFFIYFLVLFFSVISLIVYSYTKNKFLKNISILTSVCIIVLFSGIRASTVGIDNYEYSEWYKTLSIDNGIFESITSNIMDYEPGFVVINYFLKYFSLDYNYALIIYAVLIWIPIYQFIKFSKDFYFAIFVFITLGFLFFTFNGQRQAIAIGFVFLGTRYLFEKRNFKFLLSIIVATMFHFSAILMLIILLINKLPKLSTMTWLSFIIFSLILPLSFLFGIIEKVAAIFPFYGSYIQNDNFTQTNRFSAGVLYQVLFEFLILFYYKSYAKTNYEIKIFQLFLFGAVAFNLFYGNLFLSRIVVYLLFFQPLVLAVILTKLKSSKKYAEVVGISFLLIIMFVYKILFSDSGCSPYTTIF